MPGLLARLDPFKTPDARRLAGLFAIVYFAQGMWSLPVQPMNKIGRASCRERV